MKKPTLESVPASTPAPAAPTPAINDGPKPSIGRIVHYTDEGKFCAAVISDVNADGTVALHVFRRTGHAGQVDIDNVSQANVAPGSTGRNGHWSWPPRA